MQTLSREDKIKIMEAIARGEDPRKLAPKTHFIFYEHDDQPGMFGGVNFGEPGKLYTSAEIEKMCGRIALNPNIVLILRADEENEPLES